MSFFGEHTTICIPFLENITSDCDLEGRYEPAPMVALLVSVAVRAAWLWWPTRLGSRSRLAGSFVSGYSGVCFEVKFLGRHRGFDGVLFKLWPLTWFRVAQSLVPAWTTNDRWRTTARSGQPSMAPFARVSKLGL